MRKKTRIIVIVTVLLVVFAGVIFWVKNYRKANAPIKVEEREGIQQEAGRTKESMDILVKGWLEKTEQEWFLAETTPLLYGYSGRKFNLKISDAAACLYFSDEENFKESKCADENASFKWGSGDRVRIYGNIDGDNIDVNIMDIVSALPTNKW